MLPLGLFKPIWSPNNLQPCSKTRPKAILLVPQMEDRLRLLVWHASAHTFSWSIQDTIVEPRFRAWRSKWSGFRFPIHCLFNDMNCNRLSLLLIKQFNMLLSLWFCLWVCMCIVNKGITITQFESIPNLWCFFAIREHGGLLCKDK